METRKLRSRLALSAAMFAALASCTTTTKGTATPESPPPGWAGGGQPMGPPMAPEAQAVGPHLSGGRPVILVLSPGMALGFAHAGVIRGFVEQKIPIAAIAGTEMGALVGALYAATGRIQQFEWGMQRLKEDAFTPKKGLFSSMSSVLGSSKDAGASEEFEKALKQIFAERDVSAMSIPLHAALRRSGASGAIYPEKGLLRSALRAAMANPKVFPPSDWEGQRTESAHSVRPYLVSDARAFGNAVVVISDCLPEKESEAFKSELAQADYVIRPDLKGFQPEDFGRKTEIAFKGKTAFAKALPEIRKLAGLAEASPEDPDSE